MSEWRDLLVLGILGKGVCSAFVNVRAQTTTATNVGLIYAIAPVLIAAAATLIYREPLGRTKAAGIGISLVSELVIVFRGNIDALRSRALCPAACGSPLLPSPRAIYSLMLRYRPS